ncbi:LysR family transcriptional regulator [Aliiruegeria sabulilitoris]|uniref:LysR family transcriptional regulator n=1 Tax=Aliiruegeria sabulilitoris TaxID=1510458 RepID=UPI00082A20B4|nr:LysR family transcriptional regulator [Aliiruegeria sabulilitoris]NDR55238.1 LysR family transcriptional regulator [Pseudoruegeria sp. M32A2M]
MQDTLPLDDLALFLKVAETGSLSAAAAQSGVSVPTMGRKMTRLETTLGHRLFLRGPGGYGLTSEGRELAEQALPLKSAAIRISRWRDEGQRLARVRITAGVWTSRFIARNIRRIWSEDANWVPDLLASNLPVDLARRQADIGVRNKRPDHEWLAGRRTSRIENAEYGVSDEVTGFIAMPQDGPLTPTARWLRENRADRIVMIASDSRLAIDLALEGIGRVVLPCFAGDAEPRLKRLSPPIEGLGHDQWLVAHHDARHDPPVRAALDALTELLTDSSLRADSV